MSERLSYWECEHLQRVGPSVRPDCTWMETFWRVPDEPFGLKVFEPIKTKAASWARPHVCFHTTVQFLGRRRPFEQIDSVDLQPRTWPATHFALHNGLYYEIGGGGVRHVCGEWMMVWRAGRNTAHARHFNVHARHSEWDSNCDVCNLEKKLREVA